MRIFSKKGLVLVLLGIGLLLGLLGPSDARKCICSGQVPYYCPEENGPMDCPSGKDYCSWLIVHENQTTLIIRDCTDGPDDEAINYKVGCTKLSSSNEDLYCLCDQDFCNKGTLQELQEREKTEKKYEVTYNFDNFGKNKKKESSAGTSRSPMSIAASLAILLGGEFLRARNGLGIN